MSPHPEDYNPICVAIDKEKHGSIIVKWTIDHLVQHNQTLILIHVKTRHGGNAGHGETTGGLADEQIFVPYRAYCARKGVTVQEVVLEGNDVHTVLLDYINRNNVPNIVLGATSKNAIARKFWTHNVPTLINKAAPDFCSVYVVSRGRAQSVRPAARSPQSKMSPPHSSAKSNRSDRRSVEYHQEKQFKHSTGDGMVVSVGKSRNLASLNISDGELMESAINFEGSDITRVDIDTPNMHVDIDETNELQRLKQEVKQTMDLYNTACKQAISAQNKVDVLQQRKLDEMNKIEQARLAEEAALALVEIEKAKCKAAIEAAEKAQKIAEKETQRRMHAEQRAKREAEEKNRALDVLSNNDARYRKYTIEDIQAATLNFSRSLKIGEGGYGPVYKGKLDHTPVAIKALRADAGQGRKQFQQEVEVLSRIRHPNMVLLLGACPENGCLVYEFMDNGSLEDRLFCKNNTPPIPWAIRFKLAADIATGLLFLHQSKPEPLVHRDLKPANILLDHNYTCKISDVGLARLVPPSIADTVTQYHMTSAAGTFCYIDPEYQQTGKLGTKSDVYSLGVMLLQLITARPPMGLAHHVENAIKRGTLANMLDPTVPNWPIEETLRFARLALKCAELRKKDRPDLAQDVLPELNRLKEFGMDH